MAPEEVRKQIIQRRMWLDPLRLQELIAEVIRAAVAEEREAAAKIALSVDFSELRDEEKIPAGRASRIIANAIHRAKA